MKRWLPLLIIAGVLIPFAILVALGLSFTREPELPINRPLIPVATPVPMKALPNPSADAGVVTPIVPSLVLQLDSGVIEPQPVAGPDETNARLPPPLRAIDSEARRCLSDASPTRAIEVEVRFTPLSDGGYAQVRSSTQDPRLAACLEDVFQELGFDAASTSDFAPVTHVFRFDPTTR